jgi:xanthine dehydrogenase iron-sulfur cluster and FAD-binding subunit A
MWSIYIQAARVEDALENLALFGARARIVAGATDLILEIERGNRKGVDVLIDITRVAGLAEIGLDDGNWIHLGPLVTHNDCVASNILREKAYPLVRACWEVGSPQIRNRGTVAGNLVTGSPANDTITPLIALGAVLTLKSAQGERRVPLAEFYTGVRRTVLKDEEMLMDIAFPAMANTQSGTFIKFALRRAQAISLVNVAILLDYSGEIVHNATITLGAVAPTIIRAVSAENYLVGRKLDEETIRIAATLAMKSARPISDVRGTAKYRQVITRVVTQRGLRALKDGVVTEGFPDEPVLLRNAFQPAYTYTDSYREFTGKDVINTRINGRSYSFGNCHQKTLLRMLREDAGLIGTKEGCAEGECGACSVLLDGAVVMSCMVPAPRAHGAVIQTIEGYSKEGEISPVQEAFAKEGAVQCGYCTPGFIISATQLLEEFPKPTKNQIEQALTGNLCRCTGYYRIINAVEGAAQRGGE